MKLVGDTFKNCEVIPASAEDEEFAVATVKVTRGRRVAEYSLCRNINDRTLCFPVRLGEGFGVAKLKGFSWFRVIDDEIRPVS